MVAKAAGLPEDEVVLDLEDAVATDTFPEPAAPWTVGGETL